MIKRIIAMAAASLFSLNASAGYVQYLLVGDVDGDILMDDVTKQVLYYDVGNFHMKDKSDILHYAKLVSATTSFTGLGPTNLLMTNERAEFDWQLGRLLFSAVDPSIPDAFKFVLDAHVGAQPGGERERAGVGPRATRRGRRRAHAGARIWR